MGWRVARSLDVLLGQLNTLAPRRSKASDGSIGDAAHASRDSDHNPWYGPGIVTARDFTHDPAGGLDGNWLAETLVESRDPRIKYVIWNRRIVDSRPGNSPWRWIPYHGANPHTKHVHVSVIPNASADDQRAWALGGGDANVQEIEDADVLAGPLDHAYEPSDERQYHHRTIETRSISSVVGDVWFSVSAGYADMDDVFLFFNGVQAPIHLPKIPKDTRQVWAVPDGCGSISWEYHCTGPSSSAVIYGNR
ncbi:hypothetical protein [Amycolatopsis sp. NPDC059657]|uniref:hypothetical protein n=1 Tax=Amycolatopsis sp. NPDC059657 TaxID=3346899 RepID=UPI00366E776C